MPRGATRCIQVCGAHLRRVLLGGRHPLGAVRRGQCRDLLRWPRTVAWPCGGILVECRCETAHGHG